MVRRSTTSWHLSHSQRRNVQYALWPLSGTLTPWLLQRAQRGLRPPPAAAAASTGRHAPAVTSQLIHEVIWAERVAVPVGYNGTPQIQPPKLPIPFDDHHRHLIHSSLDRPHSAPQTTSGSNQPFATIHFPDRQTDRPTDGIGDSCVPRALTLY